MSRPGFLRRITHRDETCGLPTGDWFCEDALDALLSTAEEKISFPLIDGPLALSPVFGHYSDIKRLVGLPLKSQDHSTNVQAESPLQYYVGRPCGSGRPQHG